MTGYPFFARLRWSSALLGATALAVSGALLLPGAAQASVSVAVLAPGQVVEANPASVGGVGTSPSDGRLRGPDFTAKVTGVAWPQSVGEATGGQLVAGTGDRLVAFTLAITQTPEDAGILGQSTAVNAALRVGSAQLPVSMDYIDQQIEAGPSGTTETTGTDAFAAAVSVRTHDVAVVLSEGSFSQSLDLWTLARVPPVPSVLYRDPSSSSVSGSGTSAMHLVFSDPADGFTSSDDPRVDSVTLAWSAPDGSGTTPTDPNTAYLVVDLLSARPESDAYFSSFQPLPANLITFTPNGGSALIATTAPLPTTTGRSNDDGLFDNFYWFTVPATLTTGTLTVAAGTVSAVEYGVPGGPSGTVPLSITAPSSLALTFPPPATPPSDQPIPPWVRSPLPKTGDAAVAAASSDRSSNGTTPSGGGFPIWAAILILVVLVGALVAADRLRRHRTRSPEAPEESPVEVRPPGDERGDGRDDRLATDNPPATTVRNTRPVGPPVDEPMPADGVPTSTTIADLLLADLGIDRSLVVRVLGNVEITGWLEKPDGDLLPELCCFLACRPGRPSTLDDIALALWPAEGDHAEPSRSSLHTYMSRLRRAVGKNRLSDASTRRGYALSGTVTDWDRFQALIAAAEGSSDTDAVVLRRHALSLVRGIPFSLVPVGQYAWALSGGLVDQMVVAITRCAHALSSGYLASGEVDGARQAAEDGLAISPTEFDLLGDLFRSAVASGDPSEQRRVRARIDGLLGPDEAERLFSGIEVDAHRPAS